MTESPGASPPNLVVVLLDCARALSFPETGGPGGILPSLEGLGPECSIFTRASTVAPWTLPAHASLFTGRYPWEHGVMGEGRLQFNESLPTVAGILREAGYGTLALSANGLLAPLFGVPRSFEAHRCAEWWEKTLRWVPPESLRGRPEDRPLGTRTLLTVLGQGFPPRRDRRAPESFLNTAEPRHSLRDAVRVADPQLGPVGPRTDAISWAAVDGLNRIARTLRDPDNPRPLPIAPWIEATFEAWLAHQPKERPIHCFINLLDLHEKYLSNAELVPDASTWIRFARVSQSVRRWLRGEWRPTAAELDLLRRSYEAVLAGLDGRVASLIRILERAGRWENTLLVVTSDHGQAFGEHGHVFHGRNPFEPVLHIPLWIRWPRGEGGGQRRSEPVSLIDLAPTLLRAAGVDPPDGWPGVALQGVSLPPRGEPVLAMADGYPSIEIHSEGVGAPVMERLREVHALAYVGDFKAIVEAHSGVTRVFDLQRDPGETTDLGTDLPEPAGQAVRSAQRAMELIGQTSRGVHDPLLEDRLRSWGYL